MAANNYESQFEGRTDASSEAFDKSGLSLAGQLDPNKSISDQIPQIQNTAEAHLPTMMIAEDNPTARVRLYQRVVPDVDAQGFPEKSYMLGGNKVFSETTKPNETVLKSYDDFGKEQASQSQYLNADKSIGSIRSRFKDDNGNAVIIDREGSDGTPQIKVKNGETFDVIRDEAQINSLLQKEKALFTLPTKAPENRDIKMPERGGPPT
jgi:hypothetical protein